MTSKMQLRETARVFIDEIRFDGALDCRYTGCEAFIGSEASSIPRARFCLLPTAGLGETGATRWSSTYPLIRFGAAATASFRVIAMVAIRGVCRA
jgi:hypothetical protein